MVSKWWNEYQDVVEVVVVDVEPYLDSRNTKGYGTATQISKLEVATRVGVRNGQAMVVVCGSGDGV